MKRLYIQFQGQKTDLCTSLCSEKQYELNSLVDSLEEKYKLLLVAADATAENQRQNYLKVELFNLFNHMLSLIIEHCLYKYFFLLI